MKLTSLLLSSAAVLVAGSAFAADLPAKKAAPAAAVTACPAFGAGFWTVPGTDTCIKMGGRVVYDASASLLSDGDDTASTTDVSGASARIQFDVRSNTEAGVVRGVYRWGSAGVGQQMYVQYAGLTAGLASSLLDIAGAGGWNYGSNTGGGSAAGLVYSTAIGASTLSIGVMNAANNNTSSGVTDTPDLEASFSTSVSGVTATLAAASHTAVDGNTGDSAQGYAVIGQLGVTSGAVSASVYGGMSNAALEYTGNPGGTVDIVGTDTSDGTVFGGTVSFGMGAGSLSLMAEQVNESLAGVEVDTLQYGIMYAHTIATNLTIAPEYVFSDDGTDQSSTVFLRIERDF